MPGTSPSALSSPNVQEIINTATSAKINDESIYQIKIISVRHPVATVISVQIYTSPYTESFTQNYSNSDTYSPTQKIGMMKKEQTSRNHGFSGQKGKKNLKPLTILAQGRCLMHILGTKMIECVHRSEIRNI